jgi:hypothetical protein
MGRSTTFNPHAVLPSVEVLHYSIIGMKEELRLLRSKLEHHSRKTNVKDHMRKGREKAVKVIKLERIIRQMTALKLRAEYLELLKAA